MDRLSLLRSVRIFESLDESELTELAASLKERRFRAGEMVFRMGDRGHELYIVSEGQLNIHLPGEESRRISLKDIARGEWFGELALFDDQKRSASVLATTDASLLALSSGDLAQFLHRRPHAAIAILHAMSRDLRKVTTLLHERASRNAVREVEANLSVADRIADRVAALNGSWAFILGLLGLTVLWTMANSPGFLARPFDGYPFVFFNLVLAILVAMQGPLILMSQNRQTVRERAQAEADFNVNLKNEVNIETILRELSEMRAELAPRPPRGTAGASADVRAHPAAAGPGDR